MIEGGLLDGGQTRSCAFVEESKPAAQVLGKLVGSGGIHSSLNFVIGGTCACFHVVYLVKQTHQERQILRASLEEDDQIDHQSFTCLTLDFLGSFELPAFRRYCVSRISTWLHTFRVDEVFFRTLRTFCTASVHSHNGSP